MAGVTLTQLYLHDAADLSDYLAINVQDLSDALSAGVSTRDYANGRTRMVSTPSTGSSVSVSLTLVTEADRAALEGWVGTYLMLREPRGRVRWGFYSGLSASELLGPGRYSNLSLEFQGITASAEV
jgi:hypothetical protein